MSSEKKEWGPAPEFPGQPVAGYHPGLEVHSAPSRNPKFTDYFVVVARENKPMVESWAAELGCRVFTRKFKMPAGDEKWWCIVTKKLLEKMQAESGPAPEVDHTEAEAELDLEAQVLALLTKLEAKTKSEREIVRKGDFIRDVAGREALEANATEKLMNIKSCRLQLEQSLKLFNLNKETV
jgi:hypothetical protein